MRRMVAVMVGLPLMLGPWPSRGGTDESLRLPDGTSIHQVDFDRHVASLLGRLGCNAGSCHGSFQGRGGLNLSLFGADPARDFQAIARVAAGRRINVLVPDRSLVLLKATGQVPHEGGQRFAPGSWEYQVIRAWIAQGARRGADLPAPVGLEIRPVESRLERPGATGSLMTIARFADRSESDVTMFSDRRIRDEAVAEVSGTGVIRGLRPGDTAIVASYGGLVASARILVATGRDVTIPDLPATDIVDREVDAKLRALGVEPSGPSTDSEFLRRVTLDVIGTLPTPGQVLDFLADQSSDKRSRAIGRLLSHPMHAALWATRYLDITGCDVRTMEGPPDLKGARTRLWYDWFRARFAANVRYDDIARGVLCATSRDGEDVRGWVQHEAERSQSLRSGAKSDYADRSSLDLFWRRIIDGETAPVEPLAERVATTFLGIRIECAQCHKHPFDRWTQADYRSFANIVADVRFGLSPDGLAAVAALLDDRRKSDPKGAMAPLPRLREVYVDRRPSRRFADPITGQPLEPRALGGPVLCDDGDLRERLFSWLTAPENPYFARSFVNRVWAVYFGVGLVEPVDGISMTNPPSNARLLDALAADFVAHGYDIRRLERQILSSRAYQRSSRPVAGNLEDRGNFARSMPRPLMAEVLVDALNAALGVDGAFGPDAPPGSRAIEIATNQVASPDLARAFRVFGRPERAAICDCERPEAPALPQTLFLMTDESLLAGLKSGRVAALARSGVCDAEAVEELFHAALSRAPSDEEARTALDHLRANPDRVSGLADILWALINTREFVLNH